MFAKYMFVKIHPGWDARSLQGIIVHPRTYKCNIILEGEPGGNSCRHGEDMENSTHRALIKLVLSNIYIYDLPLMKNVCNI